jgi:hypothetical protein
MTQLRIASNQRIIQAQTNQNQTNNKNSDNKPVPKPHLSPQNKHFPSQPITFLNPYSAQARAILRRHPHCQHDNTVPRLTRLLDHRVNTAVGSSTTSKQNSMALFPTSKLPCLHPLLGNLLPTPIRFILDGRNKEIQPHLSDFTYASNKVYICGEHSPSMVNLIANWSGSQESGFSRSSHPTC